MRERERKREGSSSSSPSLFLSCCCCCSSSLGNVQSASLAHASTAHRLAPSPLLPLPLSIACYLPLVHQKKRVPVSRLVPAEATTTKSLSRNSFGTKTKIKEICFGARQKMLSHRFYTLTNSSCCLCCCCYSCSLCCPC